MEFTYTNALNATMGLTLFYANKGYYPIIAIHPEHDITSTRAQDFVPNLDKLYQQLHPLTHHQHRNTIPFCQQAPHSVTRLQRRFSLSPSITELSDFQRNSQRNI